jgi:hypothetical protein
MWFLEVSQIVGDDEMTRRCYGTGVNDGLGPDLLGLHEQTFSNCVTAFLDFKLSDDMYHERCSRI